MKINTLRIEPHRVKPDTSREYFTPEKGSIAWRIWIDDEKLVEIAHPFKAEDTLIDLCFEPNFPIWGDYRCFLSVRKVGAYIIWSEPLEEDEWASSDWAHLKGIKIYVFGFEQYVKVCQIAYAETELFTQVPKYQQPNRSNDSWKMITNREIKTLIQCLYPRWFEETAIYREPANKLDTTGTIILRRMQYAIKAMTEFTICEPPEKQIELRIGLDEAEFTEAIWHIGKVNGQFAILFERHPYFPLWLQSEALDKVLALEPFAKDL